MRGKFIVFEGLDGSGITTQSTLLRNYFYDKGKDVVLTKEPTEGIIGGLIKSSLRQEWKCDPLTIQMLFAADRSHHLNLEIEPALKKGRIVISDRYILSTFAFGSNDVSLELLKQLNINFRKPDLTFIVDTQPELCAERIKRTRHHIEIFEHTSKTQQIRKNYLTLRNYFNDTYVVDGNRKPDEIFNEVTRIVNKVL